MTDAATHGVPCGWEPLGCEEDVLAGYDAELVARVRDVAAEHLHRASAFRFGVCPVTVRPCAYRECSPCGAQLGGLYGRGSSSFLPYFAEGVWRNDGTPCDDCAPACRVILPGPVHDIVQVRVDGVVLEPSEYRLDEHRELVRLHGFAPVTGEFVDDDGVASLGDLRATGYDGINVSGWLSNRWETPPHTTTFTAGRAGDTLTVLIAPGDTITWDNAAWLAEDASTQAGSSVTIVGQSATGVGASGALRLTLVDGATTGSVTGTQNNPTSTGFSIVGGSSTESAPACWPTVQRHELDASREGTWEVTYRRGIPLTPMGRWAYGALLLEYLKACVGDSSCRLPKHRLSSVSRDGVTLTLLDQLDTASQALTGIPEVDAWLKLVNPRGELQRSRVWSPDVKRPRVTTWQAP